MEEEKEDKRSPPHIYTHIIYIFKFMGGRDDEEEKKENRSQLAEEKRVVSSPSSSSSPFSSSTMARSLPLLLLLLLVCVSALIALAIASCPSSSYVDPSAVDSIPSSPSFSPPSPSTLLTSPSELATSYKPTGPDANPRTGCPWSEVGLKNWHDPTTWATNGVPAVSAPTSPSSSSLFYFINNPFIINILIFINCLL